MSLQQTTRAIADPTRRAILSLLKRGRMTAGDIVTRFNITGASISRHLSVLKDAGLIRDEREGHFIYYELNESLFEDVLRWIAEIQENGKMYHE